MDAGNPARLRCYKGDPDQSAGDAPETGLEMATINGQGRPDERAHRSIETGKEADIVLFDTNRPEWQPLIKPGIEPRLRAPAIRWQCDCSWMGEQVVAGGHLTKESTRPSCSPRCRSRSRGFAAPQVPRTWSS